jgi:hypothetical protein
MEPMITEPTTELDARFSSDGARPTPWADARRALAEAELFWISTVRSDGRPHVTPLIAVWFEDALWFCTGPGEQKAKNVGRNAQCVLMTGTSEWDDGLDVVVEGDATRLTDDARLRRVATAYEEKYGSPWHFEVRDGAFHGGGGEAWVFAVAPTVAFAFAKSDVGGQTRYRFGP